MRDLVREACPHLAATIAHVRAFAGILTTLAGDRLNDRIAAVQAEPGQSHLRSFALRQRRGRGAATGRGHQPTQGVAGVCPGITGRPLGDRLAERASSFDGAP
jgi:hypothetical protein